MMKEEKNEEMNPLLKGAWFATEAFGKAFGKQKEIAVGSPPQSREELVSRIAADYAKEPPYFIGGSFDRDIYSEDCTFADDFVSFDGRDRFEANLANLGSFITEASARPLGNATITDDSYTQKFLVKLRLGLLPWSPVLAWPWGVTHVFNDALLVVKHLERWDISPTDGIIQLLTPGKGKTV